jgi:hypothetical protein
MALALSLIVTPTVYAMLEDNHRRRNQVFEQYYFCFQ